MFDLLNEPNILFIFFIYSILFNVLSREFCLMISLPLIIPLSITLFKIIYSYREEILLMFFYLIPIKIIRLILRLIIDLFKEIFFEIFEEILNSNSFFVLFCLILLYITVKIRR